MPTQVDVISKSVRDLLERSEEHRLADVLGNQGESVTRT